MPSGGGDPYIERYDGHAFRFDGEIGKRYVLIADEKAGFSVAGRCAEVPGHPGLSCYGGMDIVTGRGVSVHVSAAEGTVNVFVDGTRVEVVMKVDTIDDKGHPGSTSDEPHPLQGVPHLNVEKRGPMPEGGSGLWVDGTDDIADRDRHFLPG